MVDRDVNVDHILLPCSLIRNLLETALQIVMPDTKNQIIRDMQKSGIRLDDETAYYSLSQIRDYFHLVLGANGAEVLTDILRNVLCSNNAFHKHLESAGAKDTRGIMGEPLHSVKEYRHRRIPQELLMRIFDEELSKLGNVIHDIVYEQLSRKGIVLRKGIEGSYAIEQLREALEEAMGNEAASLLMERLYAKLFHEK